MGRQAPGGQNVIDGLLRYKKQRPGAKILGSTDGIWGLINSEDLLEITEDNYAPYRNLGGYDFLGNGVTNSIKDLEGRSEIAEACYRRKLDGLVIVGGVTTMTYAA
jgi:6-phosphofructokinase